MSRRGSIESAHTPLSAVILGLSGLKGYWKMDDGSGTNVNDYSSGNHDGTANTPVVLEVAGLRDGPGTAAAFGHQAGTEQITVSHHADFDLASAFSVVRCVRFWGFEEADGQALQFKMNGYPGPFLGSAFTSSTVRPNIQVWGGNTVCTATSGIGDIDQWHLVICTWNGTTAKIYIDGTDVSGSTTAPSPSFANGSESLFFGTQYGREVLAHVALYNRALTTTEVATLTDAFNKEKRGSIIRPLRVGIHQDLCYNGAAGQRANAANRMGEIHSTLSRNTILWELAETSNNVYSWVRHDAVMDELDDAGQEMHAVIAGSPTWANGGVTRWEVPGIGVNSAFTTWLGHYEEFITNFCTRYLGRIHRYELWNEPNLVGFWNNAVGDVDPAQYRAWYNTIRAAILEVDPDALVSFGGLASWSAAGGAGDQAGETFFRNCMAAGSMTIDYMAMHPYVGPTASSDPDTYVGNYDQTYYGDIRHCRDVLLEFGYDVPIWLTEFGWPSSGGSNTETTQRDRLQHALEGTANRLRDVVDVMCVFIDYDQSGFTNGLYSNMPNDGSAPTAKLAASMYSTFAAQYD